MIKTITYSSNKNWDKILARPVVDYSKLARKVAAVLKDVKKKGDSAVRKYSEKFDNVRLKQLAVSMQELEDAENKVTTALKSALRIAKGNIEKFHLAQREELKVVETMPGVRCWRKSVPIETVGLYIPGGTAPLFSTVLMLGVPARMAGCTEVVLCTPGQPSPALLYAAKLVGIDQVYKVGGAQAIAAMAYGTQTIPKVNKIFGPGNQYVTCAKQLVQKDGIAIDLPAGPSEVAVFADETCVPEFVAADLLSQAEHGADSQVILVSDSAAVIEMVKKELAVQLERLPRREISKTALKNSKAILVSTKKEALDLLNAYAPEHLILACNDAEALAERVTNAGSVFIGSYSPESAGDYASGTNHTLPTNGYARSYSGVSLDSFVKKITYQRISEEGLMNIGRTVITMAEAEGLQAHANAIKVRSKKNV